MHLKETRASSAYLQLREEIASGTLGPGEALPVMHLSARLGVGPSPVREALNRLASEHLVEQRDHRGFRVARLDAEDFKDLCNAMRWLFDAAMAAAVEHGDEAWEERVVIAFNRLRRVQAAMTQDASLAADRKRSYDQFLVELLSGSGSRWMQKFCEETLEAVNRYFHWFVQAAVDLDASLLLLKDIMEAAIARDRDLCVRLLRKHLVESEDAIRKSLDPR